MKNNLPVMLLKKIVLLPFQDVRLDLNNDISNKVIDLALNKHGGEILIVCPIDPYEEAPDVSDLPAVGVVGKIKSKLELPNGNLRIVVSGYKRVKILEYVNEISDGDILKAHTMEIELPKFDEVEETTLRRKILELLNDVDLDSYYAFVIPLLLAKYQESIVQAKIISYKYKVSSDIETAILTIIDDYQPYIRYWENGGKTIKEVDALKLVLTKIPKDKTLLSCFRSLNEDTINYLLKKYDFKNIETINDLVLDKLKYYLNNNIYDTKFLKNILDHKDKKYDYDNDVTEFLYQNFCFLYKNKLIIPNDVKEMIMDYVYKYPKDETLTDDDYVNLYVLYNGVIERQKLKEMLKDNHNLDYTLKEMDDTIEQIGLKIVGDSYYIPFLQEDLAEAKVIPYKKLLNKYKVLSNDDLKYFTIIDTLSLKIDTLLDKLKIKDYLLRELEASIIILISINEPYIPFLRYFFKSNKIKIKESLFKELLSIIDIYKDDIPIWIYNGYSMREFSKLKQL